MQITNLTKAFEALTTHAELNRFLSLSAGELSDSDNVKSPSHGREIVIYACLSLQLSVRTVTALRRRAVRSRNYLSNEVSK